MSIGQLISRTSDHKTIVYKGKNRDKDMGVIINLAAGELVVVDEIDVSEVFVPVTIIGDGTVVIKRIVAERFGGDVLDVWGSQVFIGALEFGRDMPTRPYEVYHPDVVQIEKLVNHKSDINGIIHDVDIQGINGEMTNPRSAGISLTGGHRYTTMNFEIEKLIVPNQHIVNGYSMDNSSVRVVGESSGDVYLKQRNRTTHKSYANKLVGVEYNPYGDVVA